MRKGSAILICAVLLACAVPAFASAAFATVDKAEHKAIKADVKALRGQLQSLRTEQRNLQARINSLKSRLEASAKAPSPEPNEFRKAQASALKQQIQATRDTIQTERSDKHSSTWDQLRGSNDGKPDDAVQADLETIVALKQQILAGKENVLQLKERLLTLLNGTA